MMAKKSGKRFVKKALVAGVAATMVLSSFGLSNVFAFADTFVGEVEKNKGIYYSDYESGAATKAAGDALNEKVGAEGFVLLKNDGVLPYAGVKRVSIFGKRSTNLQLGGSGSGGISSAGAKTIYDSLEEAGYECNPALQSFYSSNVRSGSGATGGQNSAYSVGETPMANYDRSVTESFKLYNDAAVVVFSRSGAEGADVPRTGVKDFNSDSGTSTKHYLELSDNEESLLEMVKENFDKITVVINSASAMELGELENDEKINSIIWVGTPGTTAIMALGRILNGTVNPSGKLVDIYARDFIADPVTQNIGDGSHTTSNGKRNDTIKDANGNEIDYTSSGPTSGPGVYSVMYEEGIYLGYRYYETRFGANEEAYKNAVVYPFGYGLSYTNFNWEIVSSTDDTALTANSTISVKVKVTNEGTVAGKDVVQLYYSAPYTPGGIEKSSVVLGAYAKTKFLKPGQSDTLTLELDAQDMASYDYKTGNGGYVLEDGNYEISLRTDSHTVKTNKEKESLTLNYTVANDIHYANDKVTGNKVENRFVGDYASLPREKDATMTIMSRENFETSFPQAPTAESSKLKEGSDFVDRMKHVFSLADLDKNGDLRHKDAADAEGMSQVKESEVANRKITLTLADMAGETYGSDKWDTLLNQLTYKELVEFVADGGYHTAALPAIGKDQVVDSDGPASLSNIAWAGEAVIAATFNEEIAEQIGQIVGNEALWSNKSGWYAPAMNLHRSPFSGRNFEYYSEDPLLSGKMAAATTRGAQSKGLYVYIKHFALNDMETERYDLVTYCDEQTMRELYLKPFQIAVQEGGALGVMSAFPRIGTVACDSNYALLTQVLRDEWGFQGAVVTDYYGGQTGNTYQDPNSLWAAGNDLPLSAFGGYEMSQLLGTWSDEKGCLVYQNEAGEEVCSYSQWLAVRQAAKNLLYVAANSNQMNNNLKLAAFTGNTELAGQVNAALRNVSIAASTEELGTVNVQYSVVNGALPEGVTLNATTGALSGTPTVSGEYNFTVQLMADGWITASRDFKMTVASAFSVDGDLSAAKVGTVFTATISSETIRVTDNGFNSVTYAVGSDELPAGVTLAEDGTLSGTPTRAGTYDFSILVTATRESYNWWTGQTTVTRSTFTENYTIVVAEGDGTVIPDGPEYVTKEDFDAKLEEVDTKLDGINTKIDEIASNESSGCNSSIGVTSSLIAAGSALAAAAVVLIIKKANKKKDN